MHEAPSSELPSGRPFPNLSCTTDDETNVVLLSQNCMNSFAFVCDGEVKVQVRRPLRRLLQAFR